MCNCIKETEEKIKAKIQAGDDLGNCQPKRGRFVSIGCKNIALMVSDWKSKLNIPFSVKWDVGNKTKETTIPILAEYCPFCGVEFDSGSDGKAVESKFEEDSK